MFKNIVLCETGGSNIRYIEDISKYRDILNNYKYPGKIVGGDYQVKPYGDIDLEKDANDNFDEEMHIMDFKQSLQILLNLNSQKDIYYLLQLLTRMLSLPKGPNLTLPFIFRPSTCRT